VKSLDEILSVYYTIRPLIEVAILSFIFYKAYEVIVKTNSLQIIKAAVIVLILYVFAFVLKLET